jgi:hypothetical protein
VGWSFQDDCYLSDAEEACVLIGRLRLREL